MRNPKAIWLLLCLLSYPVWSQDAQPTDSTPVSQAQAVDSQRVDETDEQGVSVETRDVFIPSESIAEDFAVPFPVDI